MDPSSVTLLTDNIKNLFEIQTVFILIKRIIYFLRDKMELESKTFIYTFYFRALLWLFILGCLESNYVLPGIVI